MPILAPQPGPQTDLAACPYDIAIFGGAAGGGKSVSLLMEGARWAEVPRFQGVLLRRTSVDLRKPGGTWTQATRWYSAMDGCRLRSGNEMDVIWRSGARLAFRGCEQETDIHQWQGAELDLVLIDELGHFTEYQFWYIMSRLRSTSGIKPYLRASCNPEPAPHWLRALVDPWIGPDGQAIPELSGVPKWIVRKDDVVLYFDTNELARAYLAEVGDTDARPLSMTFIASKLSDNPALTREDPNYRGNLAMQDRVTRAKLLDANWNATPDSCGMLQPDWFKVLESRPTDMQYWARGWDRAGKAPSEVNKDPDWTRGALIGLQRNGRAVIADMTSCRANVGEVLELICRTAAADGPHVTQVFSLDPGSAGLAEEKQLRDALVQVRGCGPIKIHPARRPTDMQTRNDGRSVKEVLAARWAAYADVGPGFDLVRDTWNGALFAEFAKFPTKGVHDDQVDAISTAWHEVGKRTRQSNAFLHV